MTTGRDEDDALVEVAREGAAEDAAEDGLAASLAVAAEALQRAADVGDRTLSVLLADDAHIQALNAQWRGIDAPTDVLSFPMDEGEALLHGDAALPLGDVVISLETARRQAAELDRPPEGLATFLLVHGVCHLLGHDHAEPAEAARMRAAEDRLLAAVAPGVKRPPTPY